MKRLVLRVALILPGLGQEEQTEWKLRIVCYKTLRSGPSQVFWDITNDASQGLLSPRGKFYLVALKQNNIPNIRARMLENFGLFSQVSVSLLRIEHILMAFRL